MFQQYYTLIFFLFVSNKFEFILVKMDGFGDEFGDILDSNGNLTIEASQKLKESANSMKSSAKSISHRENLLKTASNTLKKTNTLKNNARNTLLNMCIIIFCFI